MQHDLNDLYYFAKVVEAGGFAAAGRLLGIPKSRLSRRIAELEERLGARLLQRTTRRLRLGRGGHVRPEGGLHAVLHPAGCAPGHRVRKACGAGASVGGAWRVSGLMGLRVGHRRGGGCGIVLPGCARRVATVCLCAGAKAVTQMSERVQDPLRDRPQALSAGWCCGTPIMDLVDCHCAPRRAPSLHEHSAAAQTFFDDP